MTDEKLLAALDATGQLNRGHNKAIEDVRGLLRVEIESRKNEQKSLRTAIEALVR
jgi:hypothetical protein